MAENPRPSCDLDMGLWMIWLGRLVSPGLSNGSTLERPAYSMQKTNTHGMSDLGLNTEGAARHQDMMRHPSKDYSQGIRGAS